MTRNRRKPTEFHETSYWQSYSDMMAGVLLMFILIICGTLFVLMQVKNSYDASEIALQQREDELEQAIVENAGYVDLTAAQQAQLDEQQAKLDEQQAALDEAQASLEMRQAELADAQVLLGTQQEELEAQAVQIADQKTDLNEAFSTSDLRISIDEQTGAITMDSSVMFDYNSAELSEDGMETLYEFLPEYFGVVLSEDYIGYVSEIIIEGHTDTVGSYEYNLELSQARAEAVAAYCVGEDQEVFSEDIAGQVRSLLSVSGRSWSSPVYNADGTINADASRRVEIKFRLSDEEMISQLMEVLEEYGE